MLYYRKSTSGSHKMQVTGHLVQLRVHVQGPVAQTPVSANPGLNFNPGVFFFVSKGLSRIILNIFFKYPINKLWTNFILTVGYLNAASNNPAHVTMDVNNSQSKIEL